MSPFATSMLRVACYGVLAVSPLLAQGPQFRGGRGPDPQFIADRDVFHLLLANHDKIRRQVELLPNGVRTLTESDDPDLADKIQEHVAAMYRRVETPSPIRMRDPLFREIFRHADKIEMATEYTDKGIRVVETSNDPYVARLIQEHSRVVSQFVAKGFTEAQRNHAVPARTDNAVEPSQVASASEPTQRFAQFDGLYIPALALTKQQRVEAAARAMERFTEWWSRERRPLGELFPGDERWAAELAAADLSIAAAVAALSSDEADAAHESLEVVRDLFLTARSRHDVHYALDVLNSFHETMEAIVRPASLLQGSDLDEARLGSLRALAAAADREWSLVEKTAFPWQDYGISAERAQRFAGLVGAERTAIDALQEALAAQDSARILTAARALKPAFAKTYMFFGAIDDSK